MKTFSVFLLLVLQFNPKINSQDIAGNGLYKVTIDELYQLSFPQKIINNTNIRIDNDTLYYAFLFARLHFRELDNVKIHLKYKKMKKSTMLSQPRVNVFKNKSNRGYKILINAHGSINGIYYRDFSISSLIGWYGHEIGHIVDYTERSNIGLMVFGIKYIFSDNYMRTAEFFADSVAIFHGLGYHLLEGAEFCICSNKISHAYKQKLLEFYLQPYDIRKLISKFEASINQ